MKLWYKMDSRDGRSVWCKKRPPSFGLLTLIYQVTIRYDTIRSTYRHCSITALHLLNPNLRAPNSFPPLELTHDPSSSPWPCPSPSPLTVETRTLKPALEPERRDQDMDRLRRSRRSRAPDPAIFERRRIKAEVEGEEEEGKRQLDEEDGRGRGRKKKARRSSFSSLVEDAPSPATTTTKAYMARLAHLGFASLTS